MDRRGFLKVLGVGGLAVATAPKLLLPSLTTAVAQPERRIFLPPSRGWIVGVDCASVGAERTALYGLSKWTLDLKTFDVPEAWMDFSGPPREIDIGGAKGFVDSLTWSEWPPQNRVSIVGVGRPPDLSEVRSRWYVAGASLSTERILLDPLFSVGAGARS